MKDRVFVDTNIFVYAYSDNDALKHNAAKKLLQRDLADDYVVISTQILNEIYSVLSRSKLSHPQITDFVLEIASQTDVKSLTMNTIESCLKIKEKYNFSWWDSLILTSALEHECSILYSEDLQHGQNIENTLKIVNPFISV